MPKLTSDISSFQSKYMKFKETDKTPDFLECLDLLIRAELKELQPWMSTIFELTTTKECNTGLTYVTVVFKTKGNHQAFVIEEKVSFDLQEPASVVEKIMAQLSAAKTGTAKTLEDFVSKKDKGLLATRLGLADLIVKASNAYGEDLTPLQLADFLLLEMSSNTLTQEAYEVPEHVVKTASLNTGVTPSGVEMVVKSVLQSIAKFNNTQIKP